MSALAHYLEDEGIATVIVSLVRTQSDQMKPPRTLWVPFELGRPLGAPNDPSFQLTVLHAVLRLLLRPAGPFTEVYEVDAPGALDRPGWVAPPLPSGADLREEVAALAAPHAAFVRAAGRSTVGVSGLELAQAAALVATYPEGPRPPREHGMSDLVRLRFAADDLKAYYLEAACVSDPGSGADLQGGPSSRQLQRWLWQETALGAALQALRGRALASGDEKFEVVGGRFMVPADWR